MKAQLFFLVALYCTPFCEMNGELPESASVMDQAIERAVNDYKAQHRDTALITFLEALDLFDKDRDLDANQTRPLSAQESQMYEEALIIYWNRSKPVKESAKKILEMYCPILKEHPDFASIAFLVSASEANLGNFADFFPLYAKAYREDPNHYLAFKIKAMLYVRRYEQVQIGTEKDKIRTLILSNLDEALKREPNDTSLYRLSLHYADDNQKKITAERVLKLLLKSNITIPRGDIPYYTEVALEVNELEIAKELVAKGEEWYPQSRAVQQAREVLQNKCPKCGGM